MPLLTAIMCINSEMSKGRFLMPTIDSYDPVSTHIHTDTLPITIMCINSETSKGRFLMPTIDSYDPISTHIHTDTLPIAIMCINSEMSEGRLLITTIDSSPPIPARLLTRSAAQSRVRSDPLCRRISAHSSVSGIIVSATARSGPV
jgi:hypothetical protein